MELSSFSENIVTVPYERGGQRDDLFVNIDAFTPEFFRAVGKQFKEKLHALDIEDKERSGRESFDFFEREARALEIKREIHAELLSAGVLTGWTVTQNKLPIAPSKGVLLTLSPLVVQELWEKCLEAAYTVKKTVDIEMIPSQTTPETTETGLQEFTLSLNAPLM